MHREYLFVNDGCDRQAVEAIGKSLPEFDVVSAFTCEVCQREARMITRGKRTHIRHRSRRSY